MTKRRVVVTGIGINSPIGIGIEQNWYNASNGNSGIGKITFFDTADHSCKVAGEINEFNPLDFMDAKIVKRSDRFIQLGLAAAMDALRDAGLEDFVNTQSHPTISSGRIGVNIGAGIGGIGSIETNVQGYFEKGPKRGVSPFYVPMCIINMISGHLSILCGLKGPNLSMVTACTTASHTIGMSGRMIAYGDADIMVAGGGESSITPSSIAGFGNARALSSHDGEPTLASRPWDVERDGFVMGEGAGILVLEEYEHAKKRGAKIYGELAGFGMSSDAHHMTAPLETGSGAAACMTNALHDAKLNPDEIDYINAHGTSTPLGDIAETKAVKSAFGDSAYKLSISSTKSMTGHLLGAAGGVEAIYGLLAMQHGVIPPTINLHNVDPACDLDYVPNVAKEKAVNVVMSNSFGFGGTNGTIIFRKID